VGTKTAELESELDSAKNARHLTTAAVAIASGAVLLIVFNKVSLAIPALLSAALIGAIGNRIRNTATSNARNNSDDSLPFREGNVLEYARPIHEPRSIFSGCLQAILIAIGICLLLIGLCCGLLIYGNH